MKKNIFSWLSVFFFVAAVCAGFVSCGGDDDGDNSTVSSGSSVESTVSSGPFVGTWRCPDYADGDVELIFDDITSERNYDGNFTYINHSTNTQYSGYYSYDLTKRTLNLNGGYLKSSYYRIITLESDRFVITKQGDDDNINYTFWKQSSNNNSGN